MENNTLITTLTPASAAAAAGSIPATAFEVPSPGAAAVIATPPANQLRARNRRERGKPEFHPRAVRHAENPKEESIQEVVVPEDAVRLDYEFVLRGGREEVLRVRSALILPMALSLENLPQTESSFPEMIDRVLVQPLNTKFRAFLQRLFDAASRAAIEKQTAAEAPLPPHSNGAYKSPKPGNATPLDMPDIDCRPPLPQRPGSAVWPGPNNGG